MFICDPERNPFHRISLSARHKFRLTKFSKMGDLEIHILTLIGQLDGQQQIWLAESDEWADSRPWIRASIEVNQGGNWVPLSAEQIRAYRQFIASAIGWNSQ